MTGPVTGLVGVTRPETKEKNKLVIRLGMECMGVVVAPLQGGSRIYQAYLGEG